jgi:DNA polymerase elongation subunit (family B)
MQIEQVVKNDRSGIVVFPWGGKSYEVWDFHPYFYLPVDVPTPQGCKEGGVYTAKDGVKVKKVECKMAQDIGKLRGDRHYEAKTPFTTRYWIDRIEEGFEEKADPLVCGLDIEVASNNTPITNKYMMDAPEPIIIIGFQFNHSSKVVQFCFHSSIKEAQKFNTAGRIEYWYPTETEMLNAWIKYIAKFGPDVIAGFNLLGYDIVYIIRRCNTLNIDISPISPMKSVSVNVDFNGNPKAKIKGVALFDYRAGYLRLKRRKYIKNSLNDILERELGLAKYDGLNAAYLARAWARNPDEVLEYNYHDVDKMMLLDRELSILSSHVTFHRIFGCNLEDTLYSGKMVETAMSRAMPQFIYPSHDSEHGKVKGAEPRPPVVGLHENVIFEDLTSAYPFSMMSGNMSVETLVNEDGSNLPEGVSLDDCIDIGGTCFMPHHVRKGAYVTFLEDIFQKKDEWGKKRDKEKYKSKEWKVANAIREAYKVAINTVYGDVADKHCKFYDVRIANAVTHITRGVIDFCGHEVNKLGYQWVFGHTDSVGFVTKYNSLKKLIEVGNEVKEHLNSKFPLHLRQYNIPYEHAKMNIDFEKVARNGIFSGKTRYAIKLWWIDGTTFDEDDPSALEVKGFDAIRSDSSTLARNLQKELILDLLNYKPKRELDLKYSTELKKVEKGQYPLTEIGVPAEIKKPLHAYPESYYRAVAAMWSNENLNTNFKEGTKPFYVKVKKVASKYPPANYIAVDEDTSLPDGVVVDYKAMRDATMKKLEFLYSSMGWDINGLIGQRSLADFLT